MWKLQNITAKNLLAIRQMTYNVAQGVTTLIFGNNLDNDSQKSNGSGKSALIEAIAIGISGSPLRRVKNEEIINDSEDECYIQLTFTNDSSKEVLTVERTFYRQATSVVKCSVFPNGVSGMKEEIARSSVDEYNKFILEKLGITKEELFNNFILSKHKYQDFLSSSDRDKKEIINRFSNGNMVDRAIDFLVEDLKPFKEKAGEINLSFANTEGRIEMLVEQIEREKNSLQGNNRQRSGEIQKLADKVKYKETVISSISERILHLKDTLQQAEGIEATISNYELQPLTIFDCVSQINKLLTPFSVSLSDWNTVVQKKYSHLTESISKKETCENQVLVYQSAYQKEKQEEDKLNSDYQAFLQFKDEWIKAHSSQVSFIEMEINEVENQICDTEELYNETTSSIQEMEKKLVGIITCPNCSYDFHYMNRTFDIENAKVRLNELKTKEEYLSSLIQEDKKLVEEKKRTIDTIEKNKVDLIHKDNNWLHRINEQKRKTLVSFNQLELEKKTLGLLQVDIDNFEYEIEKVKKKVFNEAFELVEDLCHNYERNINNAQIEIESLNGSIETLKQTMKGLQQKSGNELLESLSQLLIKTRGESTRILNEKQNIEERVTALESQIQRFIEFKSYLANTKIEALNKITNEFLSSIGSDIAIKFSGYTLLKSGKLKEKISISLLRDGIDCGSYGKFSEGEKARVNLANILAMQKLININCEEGKGLDLLVLDEILESVDEDGLSSMFDALNKLQITALVVSHGNVAENYPYKLIVNKQHGVSYLN